MQKESLDFLVSLLETPSPSGYEQAIQRVVKKRMSKFADTIEVDLHGNLIAAYNPDAKVRVMLSGHCDQIGMMVHHIDEKGYVWFQAIGGIDATVLPGARVTVLAEEGPIQGIIGYKPAHLVTASERGKPTEISKLWIDLGFKDEKEAKAKVRVGDAITYKLGVQHLGKDLIASPGCDNRVGLFVCMEALRLISLAKKGSSKKSFPVAVFSASTVQEEIGLRGARTASYSINPSVGIAVDVTHASDNPGAEVKQVGVMKLNEGPSISRGPNINPVVERLLIDTAKKKKIKYQLQSAPGATGTDANAIQVNRGGVAAALIGIPNRYMHTPVEVVSLRDLEMASKLLAETLMRITSRTSFVP
jgi:putative aminopeptidase FrvX